MGRYWASGVIGIFWSKRYVREDVYGTRSKLRTTRQRFRKVTKRNNFHDVVMLACKRKPIGMRQPQRQNFNSVYRGMQIRGIPNV